MQQLEFPLDTVSQEIIRNTLKSGPFPVHDHEDLAGGGTLDEDSLALTDVTTNNASTSKHGFVKKGTGTATDYYGGDNDYHALPSPRFMFSHPFESLDNAVNGSAAKYRLDETTGTGSVAITNGGVIFSTGATNGSASTMRFLWPDANNLTGNIFDKSPEIQFLASMANTTGVNMVTFVLFGISATTIPSGAGVLTTKHFGFIYDGAVLWASNGNGTTQTKTDVTATATVNAGNFFRVVQNGSTSIKFYINGTLAATHTTNLPSGTSGDSNVWFVGIKNDAGETTNRSMTMGHITEIWNAE